jgi:adenylate cyclase
MSQTERKLAAIMFTDLVGYTSLTQRDEAGAMRLLEEHRRKVRPLFPKHNGIEVKTIGDAFLIEFASALEAVRCAYDIQQTMHDLNSSKKEEERAVIRIGIHVGDVIHSQKDVYGDAVNVASRVEPLAQPGGICVSQQVYDHVRNKFEFPLVSIGRKELKNVAESVEVFRVVLPWEESREAGPFLDKTRIAVLPFSNISPDPADEYFADGMTEELIATMSRVGGLKVIARTSVMGYKGGQKKISDVARELEVGTVLEGSVRKAGDRVRITIQLIDSKTSEHLWAESYERELKDIFAIQSEVSNTVAQALKVHLTPQEKVLIGKKQTANPEAHTLYLKGRFYWNERTKESIDKALAYFKKAVGVDPGFALTYSGISDCYHVAVDYGWMNPDEANPLAKENALKAIEIDDSLAEAHASLAASLNYDWDLAAAEREFKRAIQLRPNYATAYHWYAITLCNAGRFVEAYENDLQALEIDPYSKTAGLGVAVALYFLGRFEEAKERLAQLAEVNPEFVGIAFWKSSVHIENGEYEDAIREAERAVKIDESATAKLNLAQIYALAGRKQDAKRTMNRVEELRVKEYVAPTWIGATEILMGMKEEGFRHLEEAVETKDSSILLARFDPMWKPYNSDPRWKAVEEKIERMTSARHG